MNSTAKGFLIGCSILFVIGVIVIGAMALFLKSKGTELVTKGRQVSEQGQAFGRYVTESECLTESLTRYRSETGMINAVKQSVWLRGCLEPSTAEPDFCAGVPPRDELNASASWLVERCRQYGFSGDANCPNILQAMQGYCEESSRQGKLSRAK